MDPQIDVTTSRISFDQAGFTARFGSSAVRASERYLWPLTLGIGASGALAGLMSEGVVLAVIFGLVGAGFVLGTVYVVPDLKQVELRVAGDNLALTWVGGPFRTRVDLPLAGLRVEHREGHLLLLSGGRGWRLPLTGWEPREAESLCGRLREHAVQAESRREVAPPAAQALLDDVAARGPTSRPAPADRWQPVEFTEHGFVARCSTLGARVGLSIAALLLVTALFLTVTQVLGPYWELGMLATTTFGVMPMSPSLRPVTLTLDRGGLTLERPGWTGSAREVIPLDGLSVDVYGDRLELVGPGGQWSLPTAGWDDAWRAQVCHAIRLHTGTASPPTYDGGLKTASRGPRDRQESA